MARSTKLIGEGSIVRVGTVHDADRDGENNIMPGRQNGRYIRGGVASARVTGIIHPGQRGDTHIHTYEYTHFIVAIPIRANGSRGRDPLLLIRASCVLVILCRRCRPANRYLMNMTNAWLPANDRARCSRGGRFCATIDAHPALPVHGCVSWNPARDPWYPGSGYRSSFGSMEIRMESSAVSEITTKNILLKYFEQIVTPLDETFFYHIRRLLHLRPNILDKNGPLHENPESYSKI